ncbi:hypothetical protein [Campylobacter concisus]|nr:hypothetical protein [Campylobacter concisus]
MCDCSDVASNGYFVRTNELNLVKFDFCLKIYASWEFVNLVACQIYIS